MVGSADGEAEIGGFVAPYLKVKLDHVGLEEIECGGFYCRLGKEGFDFVAFRVDCGPLG